MFLAFYPMQNGENLPPKNDINSMLQAKICHKLNLSCFSRFMKPSNFPSTFVVFMENVLN